LSERNQICHGGAVSGGKVYNNFKENHAGPSQDSSCQNLAKFLPLSSSFFSMLAKTSMHTHKWIAIDTATACGKQDSLDREIHLS